MFQKEIPMMTSPTPRPWVAYLPVQAGVMPPIQGQLYDYLLASNGVFIHACSPLMEAVIPVVTTDKGIKGLTPLRPMIRLHTPRIPLSYLVRMIHNARQPARDTRGLIEGLYRVVMQESALRLLKPLQRASVGHVSTEGDGGPQVLLELHTHGALPAFWSRTDNRDEQGFRLYAVLGRLQDERPQMQMRIGVYGHFYAVPPTVFFQNDTKGQHRLTTLVTLPDRQGTPPAEVQVSYTP